MVNVLSLEGEEASRLKALYRATGINHRYTVVRDYVSMNGTNVFFPSSRDLEPFPTVSKRMDMYRKHAVDLSIQAVNQCLESLDGFELKEITHLITVSCTGMYAPGLDIDLIHALDLPSSTSRTAINYMGCYAAISALKVADSICRGNPSANVLIVSIELCSLHFQKIKTDDNLLANALFGDGAAATVVSSRKLSEKSLLPVSFYCDIMDEGRDDMAWNIGDFGFEMRLSAYVPGIIQKGVHCLTQRLLEQIQLSSTDIDIYAIHPGGKKILEAVEGELNMTREDNSFAYHVLKNYGNMSSPTILFVLKEILESPNVEKEMNVLSFAFGPGLTLESMLLNTA